MKKTLSMSLACIIIAASMMFGTTVSAADSGTTGSMKKLSEQVRYAIAEQLVETANDTIDGIVAYCIASPMDDAAYAVKITDKIAKTTIQEGKKIGVTIVCEYETVIIDGHAVLIDPIKVIRF